MNNHKKGLVLTTIGGLALSFDVPLVKLGQGDVWSVIATRSIVTFCAGIVFWLVACQLSRNEKPVLIPGMPGLLAALCYGISTMTFLGAIFHTATANAVFIIAFTPMFAALFGWLVVKETPSPSTILTMAVMVVGVGLIVSGGLQSGGLFGDFLALITAAALASAITIARLTRRDMGFVPLVGTAFPAVISLAFVAINGFELEVPFWVILDGAVIIPLAFWCLATGPRYLSGPEVGMFYLLETILAPIWVWMIFAEIPTMRALTGGAILILALIAHSLWRMRQTAGAQIAKAT